MVTNFLPYLATVNNRKMTLKFSGFSAVVKEHVHAKFHQAKCSGSRAISRTEKKL